MSYFRFAGPVAQNVNFGGSNQVIGNGTATFSDATRVVVMDNGFGIFNEEGGPIDLVDQAGYLFGRSLAATLNNTPSPLHWWLEEAKVLGLESQSDVCLTVCNSLIPDLEAQRQQEISKNRCKRKKKEKEPAEDLKSYLTNNLHRIDNNTDNILIGSSESDASSSVSTHLQQHHQSSAAAESLSVVGEDGSGNRETIQQPNQSEHPFNYQSSSVRQQQQSQSQQEHRIEEDDEEEVEEEEEDEEENEDVTMNEREEVLETEDQSPIANEPVGIDVNNEHLINHPSFYCALSNMLGEDIESRDASDSGSLPDSFQFISQNIGRSGGGTTTSSRDQSRLLDGEQQPEQQQQPSPLNEIESSEIEIASSVSDEYLEEFNPPPARPETTVAENAFTLSDSIVQIFDDDSSSQQRMASSGGSGDISDSRGITEILDDDDDILIGTSRRYENGPIFQVDLGPILQNMYRDMYGVDVDGTHSTEENETEAIDEAIVELFENFTDVNKTDLNVTYDVDSDSDDDVQIIASDIPDPKLKDEPIVIESSDEEDCIQTLRVSEEEEEEEEEEAEEEEDEGDEEMAVAEDDDEELHLPEEEITYKFPILDDSSNDKCTLHSTIKNHYFRK